MIAIPATRPAPLSRQVLLMRMHKHSHVRTANHASLFNTGELDLQLLVDAGLSAPAEVNEGGTVRVKLFQLAYCQLQKSLRPVYETYSTSGQFLGHYFISAFRSLTL